MDGKVVIETTVDQTGVKVGVQRLEASLRKMAGSVKGIGETAELAVRKQIDSFSRLGSQYEKQSQKVDNLKQKLSQLSETKIETDEITISQAVEEIAKKAGLALLPRGRALKRQIRRLKTQLNAINK